MSAAKEAPEEQPVLRYSEVAIFRCGRWEIQCGPDGAYRIGLAAASPTSRMDPFTTLDKDAIESLAFAASAAAAWSPREG